MKCPYCEYQESKVIDSRPTDEGQVIRRRRECMKCSNRFTTYEKNRRDSNYSSKKDKNRESYNRNKLLNGIIKSCEKRPVSMDTIEELVDEIERELSNSLKKEISSEDIGEMVMEGLKAIDEVAYVRFASVYRQFKDVNSFMEELNKILKENK